jgi:hypothetical protein
MLECFLEKEGRHKQTGFKWLMKGSNGGILVYSNAPSDSTKAGNFLTNWVTSSFSRKALHHGVGLKQLEQKSHPSNSSVTECKMANTANIKVYHLTLSWANFGSFWEVSSLKFCIYILFSLTELYVQLIMY